MGRGKSASLEGALPFGGLKVEGLSKKYRKFCLKDISFEIPPGTILGLLGRNGAGKSTIMRVLAGYTGRSGGDIWVSHVEMGRNLALAQSQIGFVLDEPVFLEAKTLWENGKAFGRLYPEFTDGEWRKWLSACKLRKADRLGQLSKGDRVKFQFAFAMSHHPKVLLLDEPTGSLDPVFRKEFLDILLDVVEDGQISVLFSSHLTSDLEQVADRIALLDQGKLLYTDSMERLLSRFCLMKGAPEDGERIKHKNYAGIVGITVTEVGFEALLDREQMPRRQSGGISGSTPPWEAGLKEDVLYEEADLSKWMYYMVKRGGGDGQLEAK